MNIQSYRIAARTEAAGKYNPSAPREGNEDSLIILPDVGNPEAATVFDTLSPLPPQGLLMVVADGMGGHNAGEVASQIAVDTVRQMFAPGKVGDKPFATPKNRADYLEAVVHAADKNVRADASDHPERSGMGSTIVMAWIVGNEVTVTWCGDSRAYRYHPGGKLEMLSEDHSMVQDMVRTGRLAYEETFAHPQGNIITRCLGGGGTSSAEPESRHFSLEPGDIVMLCSDGLSGVLFDDGRINKAGLPYSDENLQDILSRPKTSLLDTMACLFDAARRSDWYDNVTAILLEVSDTPVEPRLPLPQSLVPTTVEQPPDPAPKPQEPGRKTALGVKPIVWIAAALVTVLLFFVLSRVVGHHSGATDTTDIDTTAVVDTLQPEAGTDEQPQEPPAVTPPARNNTAPIAPQPTEPTESNEPEEPLTKSE